MKYHGGVWPTMVTPFTKDNKIDYSSLSRLISFFEHGGVRGLFAVCQSSEMFFLSLEERVELSAYVKSHTGLPVIASGHVSDSLDAQAEELTAIANTGADAVILVTNRLAREDEPDEVWIKNLGTLLGKLPSGVPLGFYECPYPYKRLISDKMLDFIIETGRFHFLKDTSCRMEDMERKLKKIGGGQLRLYNANSSTLTESIRAGAAGFSGVMANFHPDLYAFLCANAGAEGLAAEKVALLDPFLVTASFIERQIYPVNAKYSLMLDGVFDTIVTRSKNHLDFGPTQRLEVEKLRALTDHIRNSLLK